MVRYLPLEGRLQLFVLPLGLVQSGYRVRKSVRGRFPMLLLWAFLLAQNRLRWLGFRLVDIHSLPPIDIGSLRGL